MTDLSPQAQAVLDAANGVNSYGPDDCLNESRQIAAAALRALADQVVPAEPYYENCDVVREEILDIASELDPKSPPTSENS